MAMSKEKLGDQLFAFRMSLAALRDPPPPSVIDLFNRLLDEAQAHKTRGLALHDIPRQTPGAHLREVAMWAAQLQITLRG
jgi:hypothetical protein